MLDQQWEDDMLTLDLMHRARRRVTISTCPECFLEWATGGRPARDFNAAIICPDCLLASVPCRGGRRLLPGQPETWLDEMLPTLGIDPNLSDKARLKALHKLQDAQNDRGGR